MVLLFSSAEICMKNRMAWFYFGIGALWLLIERICILGGRFPLGLGCVLRHFEFLG